MRAYDLSTVLANGAANARARSALGREGQWRMGPCNGYAIAVVAATVQGVKNVLRVVDVHGEPNVHCAGEASSENKRRQ